MKFSIKRFYSSRRCFCWRPAAAPGALAQGEPGKSTIQAAKVNSEASVTPEKRPAKDLFEEARAYVNKAFGGI